MRTAELYEDDGIGGDKEFSLGMGSLLGIFFGLAVVCGVFFGFGYMIGHRGPGTYISSEPLYVAPKPATVPLAPKPSAQVAQDPGAANRVIVPTTPESSIPAGEEEAAATPPRESPASTVQAPRPQLIAQSISGPAESAAMMVQIAAVKNRPDAEALAVALRRNGFDPTVRTESQDKLIHVQVGPFGDRDQARSMRQRLASAGYNAFIK